MKLRVAALSAVAALALSVACASSGDDDDIVTESPAGTSTTETTASAGPATDAYMLYREASGALVIQNLASGEKRTQEVDFNEETVVNARCSADGSQIAYLKQRFDERTRRLEVRGEGAPAESISLPANVQDIGWAPDGGRLAMVQYDNGLRRYTISTLTIATGAIEEVASGDNFAGAVAWSPDGSRLAYYVQDVSGAGTNLYIVDAAGGEPRQLTNAGPDWYDPEWSPDGGSILAAGLVIDAGAQLYELDPASGEPTQITSSDIYKRGAQYSPDGTQIAYTGSIIVPSVSRVVTALHSFGIFLMNADGSDERAITADPRQNPGPNVDPYLDAYFLDWCLPGPWLDDLWVTAES